MLIRRAVVEDAAEACRAIRQSIEILCLEDHDNDPDILAAWLANKMPSRVASWITDNPDGVFVGVIDGKVAGFGDMLEGGRIVVNYVAPWARFQGVSSGLLQAMEQQAIAVGVDCCSLRSTGTAHRFYLARGYEDSGPPTESFGGKPAFPMHKVVGGDKEKEAVLF